MVAVKVYSTFGQYSAVSIGKIDCEFAIFNMQMQAVI